MSHDNPRGLIAAAIQARHDDSCYSYDCKCHDREWHPEVLEYVSQVALDEAAELIAEIEEAAVRRYRGFEDG